MHSLNHPIRRLRVFLASVILFAVIADVSAQEVRLKQYTREYEGVGGYILILDTTITNAGPESFLSRTNISVNWTPEDAGHRMTKTYWDNFGGAGPQMRPQGTSEIIDYVRDEWPALPDLGTNFVFYGLNLQFSDSARTNTSPVDNRGTGDFRYASYTNDTSTSQTYTSSGENGNAVTNTVINTNRVTETANWEADLAIGDFTGEGTNSFLVEVKLKPTDDNGDFVASGDIFMGTDTNGVDIPLDGNWNGYMDASDCSTNTIPKKYAQAVKAAAGGPNPTPLWTILALNAYNPLATGNQLFASNANNATLIGSKNPVCGGPQVKNSSQIDPTATDKVAHLVEISAVLPGELDLGSFTLSQVNTKSTETWLFTDSTEITLGENDPPEEDSDNPVQRGPNRMIYMIDAPGPSVNTLSYFTSPPPCLPFWPADASLFTLTFRFEFQNRLFALLRSAAPPLKWYVNVQIAGSSLADVCTSAGTL